MVLKTKTYTCNQCGHSNKILKLKVMLKYILLGKNHQYYRCNNCQTVHSFFIYSNVVKDNADKNLKTKNQIKIKDDWRNS